MILVWEMILVRDEIRSGGLTSRAIPGGVVAKGPLAQ